MAKRMFSLFYRRLLAGVLMLLGLSGSAMAQYVALYGVRPVKHRPVKPDSLQADTARTDTIVGDTTLRRRTDLRVRPRVRVLYGPPPQRYRRQGSNPQRNNSNQTDSTSTKK
ncbi:MAG: hypothetical protein IJ710_00670 [Prevotella sp.]|nr:hypothetical protein [Prevotella sp.]